MENIKSQENISIKIEDIIEYINLKEIKFKENADLNIVNLLKLLQNKEIKDDIKKQLLDDLKNIFYNINDIALIFISSPSCQINRINLIKIVIDFYLYNENLKEISKELLKYFLENTKIEKEYLDYIYEKIGKEHLEKTLDENKLLNYLEILSLFYGEDIIIKKFIPKKYFFFFDSLLSEITTTINRENKLLIKDNFSICFSFYIDEYSKNKNTNLVDITFDSLNNLIIKLEDNNINVFYNEKIYENLKINIELKEWINIKLYFEVIKENDKKSYKINLENIKNESEIKSEVYNGKKVISSISFFKNFKGKISYILSSNDKITKDCLNKVFNKFNDSNIVKNKFNFIFSPYLFNEISFEIIDPINNFKAYLYKPENNLYQNYICNYNNHIKNIYMIGGIYPIIVLFEFLYSFNKNNKNNQEIQIKIFNKLLNIISVIQKSKKNSDLIFESKFYKFISLFIENLDSEIIEKSLFIDFMIKLSDELIDKEKEKHYFFNFLFFNFNIIKKFNIKNKDKFFDNILILLNKYDIRNSDKKKKKENTFFSLLNNNWTCFEIFENINEHEEITNKMYEFLKEIYIRTRLKDECLPLLLKLIYKKKINPKIIDLIFLFINDKNKDDKIFKNIIQNNLDEIIISFLSKENRFKRQLDLFHFIQNLTQNFPKEFENYRSENLTKYLIFNYSINEFPKEYIEEAKNLILEKPLKIYNKLFYEWLNLVFKLIFIGLVDEKKIGEINIINPLKEYDDDFIFGVIKIINDFKFEIHYNLIKKNNIVLHNELIKIAFFTNIILGNSTKEEKLSNILHKNNIFFLEIIYQNFGFLLQKEPIKYLNDILFDAHHFELNENKELLNNKIFSLDLVFTTYGKFFNEVINDILITYNPKKKENNAMKQIDGIYNDFMKEFKNFFDKNNFQFPLSDIKSSVKLFFERYIIDSNGNYLLTNEIIKEHKFPTKIFDPKVIEFFANYIYRNFNQLNFEDYQIIILLSSLVLCSQLNLNDKSFLSSKYKQFTEQEIENYNQNIIYLLKMLYFKNIKDMRKETKNVFDIFVEVIEIIRKNLISNNNSLNILQNTPIYKMNTFIQNNTPISLLFCENDNLQVESIVMSLLKKDKKEMYIKIKEVNKINKTFSEEFEETKDFQKLFIKNLKYNIDSFSKIKLYKKLKYELFTWNGSYSNKNLFYNFSPNNNLKLNLKKSNHLTKEKTSPLLIPMIYLSDLDNYYNQKYFNDDIKKFYLIDLPKFNFNHFNIKSLPNNYYKCCLLTISCHYKGIISFEKDYFYFIEYDFNSKQCYGSLIKKNNTFKYKKIKFKEILFYLERRYYDQSNSIEFYTNNNKSYYFIFELSNDKEIILNILSKLNIKKPEIKEIQNYWIDLKISNLEYLMWINILGNRSLRDIHQYPFYPWLIINYIVSEKKPEEEKITSAIFDEIKTNLILTSKRDLSLPLGLMELNKKGKMRKNSYIYQFVSSIYSVSDYLNDLNTKKKFEKLSEEYFSTTNVDLKEEMNNYEGYTSTNYKEIINAIKKYKINKQNTLDYNKFKIDYDVYEKIKDCNDIELINFPNSFGSHFSNSAYISHYLTKILPFSLTSIKIQGENFDSPDRLFNNLEKSFNSVISEKSDLREIIPEFFYLPEMFININNLNLGKLQDFQNYNEIKIEENSLRRSTLYLTKKFYDNEIKVKNTFLPFWCKNNPYLFTSLYRSILEDENIEINSWIDLYFGIYSNGIEAQNILNLYSRYCYQGSIEHELRKKKYNESDIESLKKLIELGINPIQIFFNKSPIKKKDPDDNINKLKINYYSIINSYSLNQNIDSIELLYYILQLENDISLKLKLNLKNGFFLYSGYLNGLSYLLNINQSNYQLLYANTNKFKSLPDHSRITACSFYEKENNNLIYLGSEKGSILVYDETKINRNRYKLIKMIHPHSKQINYIHINSNLNMLIDCSNDGYVNLYTLPYLKIVRSIYSMNVINKVFLSSSPLPSFIVFSNNNELISYSINGYQISNYFIENDFDEPMILKGNNFEDYLIYKQKNYFQITAIKLPYLTEI